MRLELYLLDCEAGLPKEGSILYTLGRNIREARVRLGLSVHGLAALSGVPVRTILLLEWHMAHDIDVLTTAKLADVLMCNLLDETCQHIEGASNFASHQSVLWRP